MKIKELKYTELKNSFNEEKLPFETTGQLEAFNGIVGQERALNAIKSAMQIPQKGFNLYISGSIGIGKTQLEELLCRVRRSLLLKRFRSFLFRKK